MRRAYHEFLKEKLVAESQAIKDEEKRQRGPTPPKGKRTEIGFEKTIQCKNIAVDGDTLNVG